MKREEKNALSTQKILDAAKKEFAARGYDGASLNTICAENDISKGIIYHYFKDKDELYMLCVTACFDALTAQLRETIKELSGTPEECLRLYFDERLCFFTEHPLCLGIFVDTVMNPPVHLLSEIEKRREEFDNMNLDLLTRLLSTEKLRSGLSVEAVVDDFKEYMDFFNLRYRDALKREGTAETVLREHEERCHRQIDILLYGVVER